MSEPLIERLRKKVNYLSNQQPWNTVQGESIHIQDASLWDENKLSLSGNMKQEKRSGKNICNFGNQTKTLAGVTATSKSNTVKLNGTSSAGTDIVLDAGTNIPAGTYTISTKVISGSTTGVNTFWLSGIKEDGSKVSLLETSNFKDTKTIILNGTIVKFALGLYRNGVYSNIELSVQIEEGTVATENEPYGAMPSTEFPSMPVVATGVQKIRQFGKNLFDYITNFKKANNGLTNTINADGSITTIGKITSAYTKVVDFTDITNILEDGQQYTLKQDIANINLFIQIRVTKKDGSKSYYGTNRSNKSTFTVNKTADLKYDVYITTATIETWGNDSKTITDRYMLYKESNNEDDSFEPYTEEIHTLDLGTTELCAIVDANGTVVAQDRPVYRDGKWQWEKNVGKYVFDGTESWSVDIKQSSCNYYSFFSKPGTIKGYSNVVANLFKEDDTIYSTDNLGIYVNYTGAVRIKNGVSTTVAELKTWLSTNNLIAYCVLATPTYTDCTSEQSEILDKLYNNFALQKGVNNIIVETDNGVGVNMQLDYMQDLQTKLNLLEAMCVSNASQEV